MVTVPAPNRKRMAKLLASGRVKNRRRGQRMRSRVQAQWDTLPPLPQLELHQKEKKKRRIGLHHVHRLAQEQWEMAKQNGRPKLKTFTVPARIVDENLGDQADEYFVFDEADQAYVPKFIFNATAVEPTTVRTPQTRRTTKRKSPTDSPATTSTDRRRSVQSPAAHGTKAS